ncbi:hypothetical protein F2Q69_00054865 [Brassica cretica]|uniref:Uncharacterized protein n=1 Tax=Brassica cretica TaxID=69181 RepID=A0A8S9N027_BRACR|nr:hypothetical protein F2Q69_00054865 [Brassica cretica]
MLSDCQNLKTLNPKTVRLSHPDLTQISKASDASKTVMFHQLTPNWASTGGRSILRFFFLANLTCFVTFKQTSSSKAKHNKTKATCNRWKYKETAENTNTMINGEFLGWSS